jgi:hypothetical protein
MRGSRVWHPRDPTREEEGMVGMSIVIPGVIVLALVVLLVVFLVRRA